MMVVPESMIVSKLEATVFPPTDTAAPVACQKPLLVTGWYSTEPLKWLESVPPR